MAKQKSLKKTIKNNKKKKLSLKNVDFKKNWKKLSYGGALALLLFMSVGYAGYAYLEQNNLEAQAAEYTYIGKVSDTSVRACYSPLSYYSVSFSNNSSAPVKVNAGWTTGGNTIPAGSTRTYGYNLSSGGAVYVNSRYVGSIDPNIDRC